MPLPDEPLEESVYDQPVDYSPFDPEVIQPTSTRPAPLSTAPGFGDTPGTDDAADGDEPDVPEVAEPPLPEFDRRWREEFTGLIYIGALSSYFTWLGHQFHIRTLTTEELAEIALVVKQYEGTQAESKVWQAATVAACVISVDGRPMPAPLTVDPNDTPFSNRFRYVMAQWYPPILDVVYDRYWALELKVREVIEAMGNRSG